MNQQVAHHSVMVGIGVIRQVLLQQLEKWQYLYHIPQYVPMQECSSSNFVSKDPPQKLVIAHCHEHGGVGFFHSCIVPVFI